MKILEIIVLVVLILIAASVFIGNLTDLIRSVRRFSQKEKRDRARANPRNVERDGSGIRRKQAITRDPRDSRDPRR